MQQQPITSQLILNHYIHQQQKQQSYDNQNLNNKTTKALRLSQIPIICRNRRYMKLRQLHNNDFFSQQSIKLRHPLFYYLYVGQYEYEQGQNNINNIINNNVINNTINNEKNNNNTNFNKTNNNTTLSLSLFLQKNLLNLQYKSLLRSQLNQQIQNIIQIQKNNNEEQIEQIKRLFDENRRIKNIRNYDGMDKKNNKNNMIINGEQITEMEQEEDKQIEQQLNDSQYKSQQQRQQDYNNNNNNNVQYKQLLNRSSLLKHYQPQQHQITQLRQSFPYPHNSSFSTNPNSTSFGKQQLHKLSLQSLSLQQQHLIQHCQQLFLSGNLSHVFNYSQQIDNNQQYDNMKQYNNDNEEKYFQEINEEMEQGYQGYYTGVQDY